MCTIGVYMNSRQRRKQTRNGDMPSEYYRKYKNDQRCIDARKKMREIIPDFLGCGSGKGGYVMLVCNNCPAFENEKCT